MFDLEPAGTFGMYPIYYWQVSGRYFQPEPAMYSRCFCWFPGPLAPSVCNLGSSGKVGDPAGMHTRLMVLRWRQAQRSEGRFTELSTVRQARINGLHPYQRQSHRVRFNPLGRRTLQIASRFRCPDRYCAIRLRTSPEGDRRHQGHAAPS